MEAKELRIGNYVNPKNLAIVGSSFFVGLIGNNPIIPVYPIPLTEEWLIKFGVYDRTLCIGDGAFLWIDKDLTFAIGVPYEASGNGRKIKYVHQLQNLYFALTNKELTINMLIP